MYNHNKPVKYGILMISTSNAEVLRYPENPGQFYVSGTNEKTHYLVNNLPEHLNIRGRNISMDQYFMRFLLEFFFYWKNIWPLWER